jgi:hypothetical protein
MEGAPILQYPPAAFGSITAAQASSDPNFPNQYTWNATVSGEAWGNGMYEIRASSATTQTSPVEQIFDKVAQVPSFSFATNHYRTSTAEFSFGAEAGYTLDGKYYGESSNH